MLSQGVRAGMVDSLLSLCLFSAEPASLRSQDPHPASFPLAEGAWRAWSDGAFSSPSFLQWFPFCQTTRTHVLLAFGWGGKRARTCPIALLKRKWHQPNASRESQIPLLLKTPTCANRNAGGITRWVRAGCHNCWVIQVTQIKVLSNQIFKEQWNATYIFPLLGKIKTSHDYGRIFLPASEFHQCREFSLTFTCTTSQQKDLGSVLQCFFWNHFLLYSSRPIVYHFPMSNKSNSLQPGFQIIWESCL